MLTAPILTKETTSCPQCGRDKLHKHEDGLQCWYCDRILYRDAPLPLMNPYHRMKVKPNLW